MAAVYSVLVTVAVAVGSAEKVTADDNQMKTISFFAPFYRHY